jgi:predicted  nucleic acid-binding Zn-ribbon protein
MPSPAIETLLILQDRDTKRLGWEVQLKSVPRDVALVEAKIAAEKAAIETAKQELRELETKKKLIETEIGSAEAKLAKYKTQQSLVKKNDEYQALGHEIETTEAAIGDMEGQELEVMYLIDEAKKKFVAAEAVLKGNISGHEARIKTLREREVNVTAELKTGQAEVAAARGPVGEARLRVYDRIAARQQPVIVPLVHGDKCGGCHLKVSSDVVSAARGKGADPLAALPTCDQCGRIVYWE